VEALEQLVEGRLPGRVGKIGPVPAFQPVRLEETAVEKGNPAEPRGPAPRRLGPVERPEEEWPEKMPVK